MGIKIKAGNGIHISRNGDTIQLYSDPVALKGPGSVDLEDTTQLADFTTGTVAPGETVKIDPEQYTAWQRQPGEAAETGIKLKMITRTLYDKDTDKNYNYYILLSFSNTGQLIEAAGEYREVAFETTLHEHTI